jgi:hypothetical protein
VKDHWWWRPGWEPGRRYYAWHLAFADVPAVCAAAETYREALRPFGIFDEVADPWLHLTMQGIGFADVVADDRIQRIAVAAQETTRGMAEVDIILPAPQVGTEGVFFPVDPWAELQGVRLAVRSAVVDVLGSAEGATETFWPHISLAYCHTEAPTEPVLRAIEAIAAPVVRATVSHVDLILLGRDRRQYEWEKVARLTLT